MAYLRGRGAAVQSRASTLPFAVGYPTNTSWSSGPDPDIMSVIRKVISEETGTAFEDISPGSRLADLGVDSFLAPNIIATLSERVDAELSYSLLADSETLGDVEGALREAGLICKQEDVAPANAKCGATSTRKTPAKPLSESVDLTAKPYATSLLLQGSLKKAKTSLFLFPDGAGSATSYNFLPNISSDVAVYGLNCPWLRTPQDLKCSLEHYVAKFLIEVRRRQPSGPYSFGGASAGGILAYEAAQQLALVGEKVTKLILIDSPDPVGLENPKDQRLYGILDNMGVFGMSGKKAPAWLRPHFDAFLAMLDAYDVQAFTAASPPSTSIIYACDGMCKHDTDARPEMGSDDPREMLWLLNNRTDFTGAGWNTLLGKSNLHVTTLEDVNHYTILREGPRIMELSALIARALKA
ncbi:hypothetical protein LTR08_008384 [Meristemomyces frigidus]|nr:hypothetical protein LTR08_008384 [Meristemomyces frigidus]